MFANSMISCSSKLKKQIILTTTNAEYIVSKAGICPRLIKYHANY